MQEIATEFRTRGKTVVIGGTRAFVRMLSARSPTSSFVARRRQVAFNAAHPATFSQGPYKSPINEMVDYTQYYEYDSLV